MLINLFLQVSVRRRRRQRQADPRNDPPLTTCQRDYLEEIVRDVVRKEVALITREVEKIYKGLASSLADQYQNLACAMAKR